jgi:hypothetical protein
MANGYALEKLLEPDVPDDLYATMLVVFFAGLQALSEGGNEAPATGAGAVAR